MLKILREVTLWLGMLVCSILVGATVFQMIVIVPEFTRDIPNGMIEYARTPHLPKEFWASPIMPIGFAIILLTTILNWKNERRNWLLAAFAFSCAAEVLTVLYVWPQLWIMGLMDGKPSTDLQLLTSTINTWVIADQVRFWVLIIPTFFLYMKALTIRPSSDGI